MRGDLVGARKKHEEALAIREKTGEKGDASQSRLSLAEISLEEGRPFEGERSARQAEEEFRNQKALDDQAKAEAVLAGSLLAQMKLSEAEIVIASARKLVSRSGNRNARIYVAIADARIRAASGKNDEAKKIAAVSLRDAQEAGFVGLQLEARLALGEIEIKAGNFAAGRARLEALERDASTNGFALTAHKAEVAIKRN